MRVAEGRLVVVSARRTRREELALSHSEVELDERFAIWRNNDWCRLDGTKRWLDPGGGAEEAAGRLRNGRECELHAYKPQQAATVLRLRRGQEGYRLRGNVP